MNNEHTIDLIDAPELGLASSSGRATWDERGNSIWEWQTAPGVYSREISSQQLQALEASELQLMDGAHPGSKETLWSRNAQGKLSVRIMYATELVMPSRIARAAKSSAFDNFLKRLGLPA